MSSKPRKKAQLQPFNRRCPKCEAVADLRWHCTGCEEAKREHLHANCAQCSFSWLEYTADAPETKDSLHARAKPEEGQKT